jgi:Rad3-related DNA helicase
MDDELERLVKRLEATWVEPGSTDLAGLAAVLDERQRILSAIQNADATELSPETRDELARRIETVRERDQKLVAVLQNRRAETLKELDSALQARTAARGYRSIEEPEKKGYHRIA